MLNELLDEEGLDTLTAVADEIVVRSEASIARRKSARYLTGVTQTGLPSTAWMSRCASSAP